MKVYAIIPARSGSKGYPNKNINKLNDVPLIGYSIAFAKKLGVHKVICSTDSEEYAKIALELGAEVPFLRSSLASADKSMEHHILQDFYIKFQEFGIDLPDILVWLRPTFVFRDLEIVKKGIQILKNDNNISSVRTICESETRLYSLNNENVLKPNFQDNGKSMIRRQDVGISYKVYSTDIFRFNKNNLGEDFLGNNVIGLPIPKICGLDIDDEADFNIVDSIVSSNYEGFKKYIYL